MDAKVYSFVLLLFSVALFVAAATLVLAAEPEKGLLAAVVLGLAWISGATMILAPTIHMRDKGQKEQVGTPQERFKSVRANDKMYTQKARATLDVEFTKPTTGEG